MSGKQLSLVIPVFNEEDNLVELIDRCVDVCEATQRNYEIVLVDDGSRDKSREILRNKSNEYPGKVIAVLLNRNYGQHPAVLAGLAHSTGEVVVTLDADLQNPPEEIPKLLEKVDEGCDVVGSVRISRRDSWLRRLPSRVVNAVVRKSTGVQMNDYGCMLRAYRRDVVSAILSCSERSTFIPVLANSFASQTGEVEVLHASRSAGDSKYDLWKLINLQFDLLTSITSFPLRLLSIVGTFLAIGGVFAGISLIVLRLIFGAEWAANGVFTVFAGLFIFTGVQLLGLGLVGEYLSRVYDDVRARPRYFIQEIVGGGESAAAAGEADIVRVVKKSEVNA